MWPASPEEFVDEPLPGLGQSLQVAGLVLAHVDCVCDVCGQTDLGRTLVFGPPVHQALTQQVLEHLWHPDRLKITPTG